MKVVINNCFGGFSLSDEAILECVRRGMTLTEYDEKGRLKDNAAHFVDAGDSGSWSRYYSHKYDNHSFRTHPTVIAVVEEMGEKANGRCADLKVINIPFDSLAGWEISEYDGNESIREVHRSWH